MTEKTTYEIDREIAKLQQERERAVKREAVFKTLPLDQRVAIILHKCQCFQNHTDGCGWFYEIKGETHDFTRSEHRHWLGKAQRAIDRLKQVIDLSDEDQYLDLIEAVVARE